MRDRTAEEPVGRRGRLGWWFDRRAGTVGMLIAAVLLTQAGLVYVAVDQIGSSDEPMVIQPAQSSQSPRSPISVEADPPARVPAPAATRVTETVEAETPEETGVDLAAERAQPRGVAPPLTGNEPPSGDVRRPEPDDPAPVDTPADTAADDGTTDPGPGRTEPSEASSDASDPHEHQDGSAEPPADDHDTQHGRHGHGADDHEPPGQDGEAPGASGDSKGKGKDKGGS